MEKGTFLQEDQVASRWPALARVMVGRLTILFVLFIALAALGPRDTVSFYSFISLAFVINIPYALWLRDERTAAQSKPLQFLVDALLVTGLVHFTGGLSSELVLLYPLVILSAGLVVSGEFSLKVTLLCIALYATLIVLEMQGIVKYYGPGPFPYTNGQHVVQALMLRIFVFTFFTAASGFLSDKLLSRSGRANKADVLSSLVCEIMPPIVLCADRVGTVLYANGALADFIGHPASFIRGQNVATLVSDFSSEEMTPDLPENRTLTFLKTDGMSVRVPCSLLLLSSDTIAASTSGVLPELAPPVLLTVGWVGLSEDAGKLESKNGGGVPPEFLAECRHALLNAMGSVKASSSAFLDILEHMKIEDGTDSSKDRELAKGLAKALAMGTDQLQKTIEELFAGPPTSFLQLGEEGAKPSVDDV